MELKPYNYRINTYCRILLIVPYGIETYTKATSLTLSSTSFNCTKINHLIIEGANCILYYSNLIHGILGHEGTKSKQKKANLGHSSYNIIIDLQSQSVRLYSKS